MNETMAKKKTNAKLTGSRTDEKPREPMMTRREVEKLIDSKINAFEAVLVAVGRIQPRAE